MKIIGIIGMNGSGKGTVVKYIVKNYGYNSVVMGDLVREEANQEGLELTRDNLCMIADRGYKRGGKDYWLNKAYERIIKNNWNKVVIDGIRQPRDVEFFKEKFGKDIIIVLIDAKPEIRFEREKKRGRPGFPKSFEEFFRYEKQENRIFNLSKTLKLADYTIDNNGSFKDLYVNIEKFLEKFNLK